MYWTLFLNAIMGVALLTLFELNRGRRSVYGPRLRGWTGPEKVRQVFGRGQRLPLAWVRCLHQLSDRELADLIGLDAYMVIRFARMWRCVFFRLATASLIIMAFYHHFGKQTAVSSSFYALTMASLKFCSRALWLPTAFAYAFSVLALLALKRESKRYLTLRKHFLATVVDQTRCSLLVERVPQSLRNEAKLRQYFELLAGAKSVHSVVVYKVDMSDLTRSLARRDRAAAALLAALGHSPRRVMQDLSDRLNELDAICREKAQAHLAERQVDDDHASDQMGWFCHFDGFFGMSDESKEDIFATSRSTTPIPCGRCAGGAVVSRADSSSSSAIVTMCSAGVAADLAQIKLSSEPFGLVASAAPQPMDVVWENVGVPKDAIAFRKTLADIGLCFAALALTPLVSLIQLVSNLDEIARLLPAVPVPRNNPNLRALITGYLPVILLMALYMVVPFGLEFTARSYVRFKSLNAIQAYVLPRYFAFLMLAVYVTVLAGSLSATLRSLIDSPKIVLSLLGTSVPAIAPYFLQYLIVKIGFSLPYELARPWPYLSTNAVRKCCRQRHKQYGKTFAVPPDLNIGVLVVPELLMVLMIGALYASIAPLVLCVACLYFALAEIVYTRQFLFVYISPHDEAAKNVWPAMTRCAVAAIFVAQLATLSYLSLLGGDRQATALAPLPLFTLFIYRRGLVDFYEEPAAQLDRHTAVRHDLYRPVPKHTLDSNAYRHPALLQAVVPLDSASVVARYAEEKDRLHSTRENCDSPVSPAHNEKSHLLEPTTISDADVKATQPSSDVEIPTVHRYAE